MKYKKEKINGLNLHMIKTNRFKTVTVSLIFHNKIVKDKITMTNVLADALTYSTKRYPTKRDMMIAEQDLYACELDFSCYRVGSYYNTDISLLCLNEKYTEKGMFDKTIAFLASAIYEPNVNNGAFDSVSFNIIKNNTLKNIESIKENTRKYSLVKMLEHMDKDALYALHGYGYIEDLEKINEHNLFDFYKEFINSSELDIYVIGDIDYQETINLFQKYFKTHIYHKKSDDLIIEHDYFRRLPKKVVEPYPTNQAKLSIGFKLKDLTDFERNYVLTIFNMILGGGTESKLFRNVREKNSLCYYINSSSNKVDNLLFVTSGISKKNFSKVVKLIKTEIKNIQNGQITQEEIEESKVRYLAIIDEMYDYPNQIISFYYAKELLNSDLPDERRAMINKVTIDDIIKLSKKIYIDTIYLLGGDIDEEN